MLLPNANAKRANLALLELLLLRHPLDRWMLAAAATAAATEATAAPAAATEATAAPAAAVTVIVATATVLV